MSAASATPCPRCGGPTAAGATLAIQSAIARIGESAPALRRHLGATVRTGTFFAYLVAEGVAQDRGLRLRLVDEACGGWTWEGVR